MADRQSETDSYIARGGQVWAVERTFTGERVSLLYYRGVEAEDDEDEEPINLEVMIEDTNSVVEVSLSFDGDDESFGVPFDIVTAATADWLTHGGRTEVPRGV